MHEGAFREDNARKCIHNNALTSFVVRVIAAYGSAMFVGAPSYDACVMGVGVIESVGIGEVYSGGRLCN